jgi:single-strand DNA-binding protein
MPSKNLVILMGNVGKTVETRFTGSGIAVTSFSIATNERRKNKETGEWKSLTDWHNIVAWGKLGELAADKVKTGDLVQVFGKMRTRSWEHNGTKYYRTEVLADELQPLGRVTRDAAPSEEEVSRQEGQEQYDDEQFDEADLARQDA